MGDATLTDHQLKDFLHWASAFGITLSDKVRLARIPGRGVGIDAVSDIQVKDGRKTWRKLELSSEAGWRRNHQRSYKSSIDNPICTACILL